MPETPKDKPPEAKKVEAAPDDYKTTGVDFSKISEKPQYHMNGRLVTEGEVYEAIENGLPADENKLRLTIFGSLEQRRRILGDLQSCRFAALVADFSVQAYDRNNPVISGLGFALDADPTIYVQKPNGEVVHRQEGYDGPERFYTALQRAADPNYDKRNDPDLRVDPKKPNKDPVKPPGVDAIKEFLQNWGVLILAVVVVFVLLRPPPRPAPQPPTREESDLWRI